jgi:hypothetical protein
VVDPLLPKAVEKELVEVGGHEAGYYFRQFLVQASRMNPYTEIEVRRVVAQYRTLFTKGAPACAWFPGLY